MAENASQPQAPTVLWLARFKGRIPNPQCQLLVAPLSATTTDIQRALRQHPAPNGNDSIEFVKINDLAHLLSLMPCTDVVTGRALSMMPEAAQPTKLIIEMTYDDASPDQQTPSRQESVLFPCLPLAEQAERDLEHYVATSVSPDEQWRFHWFIEPWDQFSCRTDHPTDAVALLASMIEDDAGGDDEDEDDE